MPVGGGACQVTDLEQEIRLHESDSIQGPGSREVSSREDGDTEDGEVELRPEKLRRKSKAGRGPRFQVLGSG